MNAFILSFCCLAVATTSGGVIKYIPLGSAGSYGAILTSNALNRHGGGIHISVSSSNLHSNIGQDWDHEEEGEWNEEQYEDGVAEKYNDWNAKDEENDAVEYDLWDDDEGQWTEDYNDWHRLVKRDVPARQISNGPEGKWNKEEERYEYNDSSNNQWNNDEDKWINDKVGGNAPIDSIPIWGHGHGW